MRLNQEEIFLGCLTCLAWFGFFNLRLFIIAIISSGLLWAFGGTDWTSLNWRRIGVPLAICSLLAISCNSFIPLISLLPFHLILRLGYGVPVYDRQGNIQDKGSMLGRYFWKRLGGTNYYNVLISTKATYHVRRTIALLICLIMTPLAYFNMGWYVIGLLTLTFLMPIVVLGL